MNVQPLHHYSIDYRLLGEEYHCVVSGTCMDDAIRNLQQVYYGSDFGSPVVTLIERHDEGDHG